MEETNTILVNQQLVIDLWNKMNKSKFYLMDEITTLIKDTDKFLDEVKGKYPDEFSAKFRIWEGLILSNQQEFDTLTYNFFNAAQEIVEKDKLLSQLRELE